MITEKVGLLVVLFSETSAVDKIPNFKETLNMSTGKYGRLKELQQRRDIVFFKYQRSWEKSVRNI